MTTFQSVSLIPNGENISKRASIAATICFILYFVTFNSKRKQVNGINEIPMLDYSIPYFGHIFQINRELPALQFHEWHKKYGPIFRIKLGVQNWVVISDRYMAHDILAIKGSITGGRPRNTFSKYHAPNHGGFGLINPDQTWKQNRTLSQEMLSSKSITMSAFIIQAEAERIADQLLKNAKEGSGVNIIKYMQLVVVNIIMQITFGLRAGTIDDPVAGSMLDIIDKIMKFADLRDDIGGFLPHFASLINIITRKEKAMSDYVNNSLHPLLRQFIKESYKTDTECFVKQLYKAMNDDKIDEPGILALCSELAGAGVDTTAMTLSWGFVILCHHKDVQQKIQNEIDMFVTKHNRLPTFEERGSLPFLLSVQKECMRYRPSVHINLPHTAQKDVYYNGYLIPEGTVILGNIYSLCRNGEYYDDPDEFKPDRYLNDTRPLSAAIKGTAESREQHVFGWGRRICPGVHLADVILFNVWVRILHAAVIEPPLDKNGNPMYPDLDSFYDAGVVVGPGEPHLRFIRRTDGVI